MKAQRTRGLSVTGLGLAALGGAGLIAAFPPIGIWPLIFVSFVPIAVAQHRLLPPRWAGLAPCLGIGSYVAYLAWGGLSPSQRWWLLLLAPLLAGAGWFDRRAHDKTRRRHLWWSSPVVWTGSLFAVGLTPVASWLDPAYALYREPWLIQPVSVFAVSGLNLLILLTNYSITTLLMTPDLRVRIVAGAVAAGSVAAWVAASAVMFSDGRGGPSIRVAAVQPGRTIHLATGPATARSSNAAMLALLQDDTVRAAADGARLVVWPEMALQYVDVDSPEWRSVQNVAVAARVYLVFGYSPDPHRFNRAAVLDPDGRVLAVYDKQHPVTFAGDHSAGGPSVVTSTAFGVIAPIICYDLDFQNTARAAAGKGATLLAVPSEDWAAIARQHYTHLVFRAVENHVAAVKTDTAWDSAVIDPHGRIVAAHADTSPANALLVQTVALGTGRSFFVDVGDWVGWTALALSVCWLAVAVKSVQHVVPAQEVQR